METTGLFHICLATVRKLDVYPHWENPVMVLQWRLGLHRPSLIRETNARVLVSSPDSERFHAGGQARWVQSRNEHLMPKRRRVSFCLSSANASQTSGMTLLPCSQKRDLLRKS